MKKLLVLLAMAFLVVGCSSKSNEVEVAPKLVVGEKLELNLNDQHEKATPLAESTTKVVFAFSKDVGHFVNDFLATKDANYLQQNNAQFVADVSAAPSLIRSMFIMPGLKEFAHTILVFDDEAVAAPYRADQKVEKIILVSLDAHTITKITPLDSVEDLQKALEK